MKILSAKYKISDIFAMNLGFRHLQIKYRNILNVLVQNIIHRHIGREIKENLQYF